MVKIGSLELYVGTKEEYKEAVSKDMAILCALNRADGYVTHQSEVGWTGRGCPKDHPDYLYKHTGDALYLNMIDADEGKYFDPLMINTALDFIWWHLDQGNKVFVYCSMGESRAPSLALMYLLQAGLIEESSRTIAIFRERYYPKYKPRKGILEFMKRNWKI